MVTYSLKLGFSAQSCAAKNKLASRRHKACRASSAASHISRRHLLGVAWTVPAVAQTYFDAANAKPAPASVTDGPRIAIGDLQERLLDCYVNDQYVVSGKVDPSIFDDSLEFSDPTISVKGREEYASSVARIFNADASLAEVIKCDITGPNSIELKWRLFGVIKPFPGGPTFNFKPYTGTTLYTIDPTSGKILKATETWDVSSIDLFLSCFIPGFGKPAAPPVEELRAKVA